MMDEDYAYERRRQRKIDELAKGDFIVCPACKGECGIDVASGMQDEDGKELSPDWHDCDTCDATGFVNND